MPMPTPRNAQQGVMLLEALIGLLIFSIGILALLAMQATSMRVTVDAKYRSEASFLVNEIVGVMWSNPADLTAFSTANCESTPTCDAWRSRVIELLPNAATNVPTIDVAGRQVTVTVFWQRPGEPNVSNHQLVAQIARAED